MSKKISSIYIAKALSIIVIVAGHFTPENPPTYWEYTRKILSSSNMALFFFLSGYLLNYSKASFRDYHKFIKDKFNKVLVPALIFTSIILIVKVTLQKYFTLQNPVTTRSIIQMVVNPPDGGFYPLIWFLYTLFLFFLIFPLIKKKIPDEKIILGISILLYFIDVPEIFCFNHLLHFLPAFTLGFMIAKKVNPDNLQIRTIWITFPGALIIFVLSIYFKFAGLESMIPIKINLLFMQLSGIIIYMFLARIIKDLNFKNYFKLLSVGRNTLIIYFLHTFIVGSIRIIFKDFTYTYFEIILFISVISGVYIPIILKKVIFRKYWFTKKFLLGES